MGQSQSKIGAVEKEYHPQGGGLCCAGVLAGGLGDVGLVAHVAHLGAQGLLLALRCAQLAHRVLQHLLHVPQLPDRARVLLQWCTRCLLSTAPR